MKSSQQMRRPLVGLALSMAAGLYLQQRLQLSALCLLGSAACVLAPALACRKLRLSGGIYAAALLLAGAYGAVESLPVPAQATLPVAEVLLPRQDIAGTVAEDPEISGTGDRAVFKFRVEAVRFPEGWRLADRLIRVRSSNMHVPVAYGERWRLTGRYSSYEKTFGGVAGSFYTDGERAALIRKAPRSFRGVCYQARRRAASVLERGMDDFPEQVRLLLALLLGYRHELPNHLHQTFSRTGTLHIFAISGLHVGVMAAILIAGLKVLGISRPKWGWFLIPLLFFYVVSTGMKPSAFRAFTMASAYFAAPLVHRRPDTVSALSLAAMILLAMNPAQLNDPGFLLSFTVVSGIVMVHLFAVRQLHGRIRPGRIIWARLGGPRPLSVFLRTVGMLALTSLAAWLFSAPLTAAFFNTFSPAALVANLAIIPLTFMIILTGCFSLLAAPLLLPAGMVFNHANRLFIGALMHVIQRLGDVPGAYRFVSAPSFPAMFLWYAGLVLVFAAPPRSRRCGAVFALCALLLWLSGLYPPGTHRGMEVSRDAGLATMISVDSAPQALAAKGDAYSLSRAERFLKGNAVNRLPVLAITGTEADPDAVDEICRTFSVEQIWLPTSLRNGSGFAGADRSRTRIIFSDDLRLPAGSGTVSMDLR
jgi:ComEC/Rec2-related protein